MIIERLSKHLKANANKITVTLGEVEIQEKIGQGGNSVVYKAVLFGKPVAIKILTLDHTGAERKRKLTRFLAEYFNVLCISDLSKIVRYIDYDLYKFSDNEGETELQIIIMKLYDGSLVNYLVDKSEVKFLALFDFLLDVIEKVHIEGIYHRDIKPENILIDGDQFVLTDFGIASYNPEMFQLMAETLKKERLGNRQFSAPEQEIPGTEPHPTMDIFALGQILQWYVLGAPHRGTGRQRITSIFPELFIYDEIIEKCLKNNPVERYQSIAEIKEFLNVRRVKDVWEYLHLFDQIIRKSFPKDGSNIIYTYNIDDIDRVLQLMVDYQKDFDHQLCFHDPKYCFQYDITKKGPGKWKFGNREFDILEIWVYNDGSQYNDFILAHYIPGVPFILEGKHKTIVGVVDGNIMISHNEVVNGYAVIDGVTIDLAKHDVEVIERTLSEGYFFLGTQYHCISQRDCDRNIYNFIGLHLRTKTPPNSKEILDFANGIRDFIHPKVEPGI